MAAPDDAQCPASYHPVSVGEITCTGANEDAVKGDEGGSSFVVVGWDEASEHNFTIRRSLIRSGINYRHIIDV